MKTTTITCDRCRQEITADRVLLTMQSGPARLTMPNTDLCTPCFKAFQAWLSAGDTTKSEPGVHHQE